MIKKLFQSIFISGILFSGLSVDLLGQLNTLLSFSLEDQFDHTYTNKEYQDYYVILLGGDRKGSDYCFLWSDAIKEELEKDSMKEEIKVLGIADLQAAPSSFQSFVKAKFPKEKKYWVLLDWDGIFADAYNFKEDVANIIIFNQEGNRIYTTSVTEFDKNQLNRIILAIHKHSSAQK